MREGVERHNQSLLQNPPTYFLSPKLCFCHWEEPELAMKWCRICFDHIAFKFYHCQILKLLHTVEISDEDTTFLAYSKTLLHPLQVDN